MMEKHILWCMYAPKPENIGITCAFDLPSGKKILLSIWLSGECGLCARAVDRETGLLLMPYFQGPADAEKMEEQALRYGEPLIERALH